MSRSLSAMAQLLVKIIFTYIIVINSLSLLTSVVAYCFVYPVEVMAIESSLVVVEIQKQSQHKLDVI